MEQKHGNDPKKWFLVKLENNELWTIFKASNHQDIQTRIEEKSKMETRGFKWVMIKERKVVVDEECSEYMFRLTRENVWVLN